MKTLIILMFIMLGVLLALNIALYINLDKRINYLKYLCTNSFKEFNDSTNSVYSHINSIYKNIKDLTDTVLKCKEILYNIEAKYSDINNQITTYVHKDNDANKKELINCMANSFTDMRTHISNIIRDANKERNLDINDELLAVIKKRIDNIQKTINDANLKDIKVVSSEELAKISFMLKDTLNWMSCIYEQIKALDKLKTATKSKSTKSDKSDAKKKAPLL